VNGLSRAGQEDMKRTTLEHITAARGDRRKFVALQSSSLEHTVLKLGRLIAQIEARTMVQSPEAGLPDRIPGQCNLNQQVKHQQLYNAEYSHAAS
jgi:hypothetical protein